MLNLFFFLLFYFIAASEGGANVFEVTYFKGTVSSQSLDILTNCEICLFCRFVTCGNEKQRNSEMMLIELH